MKNVFLNNTPSSRSDEWFAGKSPPETCPLIQIHDSFCAGGQVWRVGLSSPLDGVATGRTGNPLSVDQMLHRHIAVRAHPRTDVCRWLVTRCHGHRAVRGDGTRGLLWRRGRCRACDALARCTGARQSVSRAKKILTKRRAAAPGPAKNGFPFQCHPSLRPSCLPRLSARARTMPERVPATASAIIYSRAGCCDAGSVAVRCGGSVTPVTAACPIVVPALSGRTPSEVRQVNSRSGQGQ